MSTENTEANVADKLAQALRDLMDVSYNYGVPHDIKERAAARAVLAEHEAEKAQALPNGRQFRKKPVVIEAFQMTVERRMDNSEWPDWLNEAWNKDEGQAGALFRQSTEAPMPDMLCIQTLEGAHLVGWGDWIIRGVKGELYPCKPDIFAVTYEPATAAPAAPVAVPEGFAPVPLRMTTAMQYVTEQEDWTWEDLLASAEAITEEQYGDIAAATSAPVAVRLTDEEMCDALRQCPQDVVENLRVRWLYATDFARVIERACAARWGIKLEGGQG